MLMLTDERLDFILERIPRLTVGVLGDLFLDRYLEIDAALTEPSIETGLDAYQVTRVRSSPGAAGTVINNLVALGVGRVVPISVIGADGEGYELRQALERLGSVDVVHVLVSAERRTPTYTKPMLHEAGQAPRELNRLDIKNRHALPAALEDQVLAALAQVWPGLDALLVMDQVSEADCGVVTRRVRERLAAHAAADAGKFVLADSRERIGLFRHVSVKPNRQECGQALAGRDVPCAPSALAAQVGRPVFCTDGPKGILVARLDGAAATLVPAYPVRGPIDIVGAGDSTSAAIGCASAAGATLAEAAAFGNLVASITIQQLGTTGIATPEQVRARWREVCRA